MIHYHIVHSGIVLAGFFGFSFSLGHFQQLECFHCTVHVKDFHSGHAFMMIQTFGFLLSSGKGAIGIT